MKIENLIKQLGYNFQSDVEIDNLTIDSHLINEKSLFIALKGEHFDAYNLINEQLLSKVGFVFTYSDASKLLYRMSRRSYKTSIISLL